MNLLRQCDVEGTKENALIPAYHCMHTPGTRRGHPEVLSGNACCTTHWATSTRDQGQRQHQEPAEAVRCGRDEGECPDPSLPLHAHPWGPSQVQPGRSPVCHLCYEAHFGQPLHHLLQQQVHNF